MNEIKELIIQSLKENFSENYGEKLSDNTPIFGGKSKLDSLGLVTFLITLEQKIEDNLGKKITIADEKAISMKNSPFRNISTLKNFIFEKI
jgi:D-alanine--poly(phosphoribitol) ligase subunit 2